MLPIIGVATFSFIGMLVTLAVLACVAMRMADPSSIGPQDSQLQLQTSVTKTSTFSSTGIDLGSGFAPSAAGLPMQVGVFFSAGDFTTGDETYTFKLQESDDNSSFSDCSAGYAAGITASVAAGTLVFGGFVKKRYVRLVATLAGTTPSVTYQSYLEPFTVA